MISEPKTGLGLQNVHIRQQSSGQRTILFYSVTLLERLVLAESFSQAK